MKYLLFNLGKNPDYFKYCINSILSTDKDADIYLCTDQNINSNEINVINFNDFETLVTKKNEINELFKNTSFGKSPLWSYSILRIFALNEIAKKNNIDSFIHFDNDVLIYKSWEELKNKGMFVENKINITPNDNNTLVFGYSYFSSIKTIERLVDGFNEILRNYDFNSNIHARGGHLNEMRILRICQYNDKNLFNELPTLPYFDKKIIFDPSSYGQYLNGTHLKRGNHFLRRRFISTQHIVGREIKSKRIKVKFENNEAKVFFDKNLYQLANLHIHSKNLKKYLPKNYKNYINL
mgnify:CR=1 FL=1